MVGKHRVKLIQRGASDFTAEFRGPLAAFEVMYDDVEAQRAKMEQAGFTVLHERTMKSGRKAYYFGSQFEGLPFGLYATADDGEVRGLTRKTRRSPVLVEALLSVSRPHSAYSPPPGNIQCTTAQTQ